MSYAAHATYGLRKAYGPFRRPVVYAFPPKGERDEWVDADRFDGDFHREPMAAREARRWLRNDREAFAPRAWRSC